jgi:hypothetical protein
MGVACLLSASPALAVRPFITDDARVVGFHQAQVESWVRYDKGSLQHWVVPAFGPVAPLEVTMGGVHGIAFYADRSYSLAAPFIQAKLLLHEAKAGHGPGIAIIGGTFFPFGFGGFVSPPNAFTYAAFTQVFGEDAVLLHANVGLAVAQLERPAADHPAELEKHEQFRGTWGIATQIRLYHAVNLAAEIFSGDPYAEVGGGAMQGGFRFVLTDSVQFDTTTGAGLWGGDAKMSAWISAGLRFVSKRLY